MALPKGLQVVQAMGAGQVTAQLTFPHDGVMRYEITNWGGAVTTASGAQEPVINGFKTDDGETGNGKNVYIPTTAVYADGRTGVEMQNGYCLEYRKTIWNILHGRQTAHSA